jgi:hypothetical protein
MNNELTAKELEALTAIYEYKYHNNNELPPEKRINNAIYICACNYLRNCTGIIASLSKKGLAGTDGEFCWITRAGYETLREAGVVRMVMRGNIKDAEDLKKLINSLPYMYPVPIEKEEGHELETVFVPSCMKEWVAGWTGDRWILLEYPFADNSSVKEVKLPGPSIDISFVHLAQDEQKNLYMIQAFSPKGRPMFDWCPDGAFPFPLLPREVLVDSLARKKNDDKGKIYLYDILIDHIEMPTPDSGVGYFELWFILKED